MNNIDQEEEFMITGKIHDINNNEAIIQLPDNQTLRWPVKHLPHNTKKGEEIILSLYTNKELQVKNILNELLKTDN